MPRLAVLFVLSSASSPCPDLNLIHYICLQRQAFIRTPLNIKGRLKPKSGFQTTFFLHQ
ncbi:hypothetical protein NEISICOT_02977 [Neisseria sicca ATCC 29256]|uniref:Uncharacterized protein n=1 Tax=Neisseria sicca ATCC 29256 TaxID=547045 RepID=C6M8V2_NEISI|nr:hypothetical protein NEISICOT_02977 [Neisseria sicca ATCC 29256]